MAEHVLNDFKEQLSDDGLTAEFSFKLEDKGPNVAWSGKNPVVTAKAKIGAFGELLIEGVITEGAPTQAEQTELAEE